MKKIIVTIIAMLPILVYAQSIKANENNLIQIVQVVGRLFYNQKGMNIDTNMIGNMSTNIIDNNFFSFTNVPLGDGEALGTSGQLFLSVKLLTTNSTIKDSTYILKLSALENKKIVYQITKALNFWGKQDLAIAFLIDNIGLYPLKLDFEIINKKTKKVIAKETKNLPFEIHLD